MLSYFDEVISAHMQERRSHLLAEAATHRLLRKPRAESVSSSQRQLRRADRWLAALGVHLVMWGERLQANARSRQVEAQEIVAA